MQLMRRTVRSAQGIARFAGGGEMQVEVSGAQTNCRHHYGASGPYMHFVQPHLFLPRLLNVHVSAFLIANWYSRDAQPPSDSYPYHPQCLTLPGDSAHVRYQVHSTLSVRFTTKKEIDDFS